MEQRLLGQGLRVSAVGLGCMGMSEFARSWRATCERWLTLSAAGRQEFADAFPPDAAAGMRYPEGGMRAVNL